MDAGLLTVSRHSAVRSHTRSHRRTHMQITRAMQSRLAMFPMSPLALLAALLLLPFCAVAAAGAGAFPPRAVSGPYIEPLDPVASMWANIAGPAPLTGSVALSYALFAAQPPATTTLSGVPAFQAELAVPKLIDGEFACQPINSTDDFGESFVGKILMVKRGGGCVTDVKIINAAAAGAAAMIWWNKEGTGGEGGQAFGYIAGSGFPDPLVPTVYMSFEDGLLLNSALRQRNADRAAAGGSEAGLPARALFQMVAPGQMVAAEKQAIYEMIGNGTMLANGPDNGFTYGDLKDWSPANVAANFDPCVAPRLSGLWCENGHLVELVVAGNNWEGTPDLLRSLSAFTELRVIYISYNALSGDIPSSWCSLVNLVHIDIQQQLGSTTISSLPACLSQLPKLSIFRVNGNSIPVLPNFSTNSIKILDASSNALTAFPASFSTWTSLHSIDASNNQIVGLPSFAGFVDLWSLNINRNPLGAALSATSFDGLPALQVFTCSDCSLSGVLPRFQGSSALNSLDLSKNSIGGPLPAVWVTNVPALATLQLRSNALVSPIPTFGSLSLQTIDLRFNQLTSVYVAGPTGDAGFALEAFANPSLTSISLDNNLLAGIWPNGYLDPAIAGALTTITLSHNQITSVPSGIFTDYVFTSLDLSFNNITVWSSGDEPPPALLSLNLKGNPNLHPANPLSWIQSDPTSLLSSPGSLYLCPVLSTPSAIHLQLSVDAFFVDYKDCVCAKGTFGLPPLCSSVPLEVELTSDGALSSPEVGPTYTELVNLASGRPIEATPADPDESFSDKWYGNQRLTVGLSTSWVVNSRVGNYTIPLALRPPARVLTLRFHLSRAEFKDLTDVITVFDGPDASGNRLALIRGTDVLPTASSSEFTQTAHYQAKYGAAITALGPTSLLEVVVFGSVASVFFSSRDESGTHFEATYHGDEECSVGYFFDEEVHHCRANPTLYQVSMGIRAAVFAVGSLAVLFVLISIIAILIYWEHQVIRAASRPFLLLTVCFLGLLAVGSLLYAAVPNEDDEGKLVCNARAWLTAFPLTGVFAVLLAKSNRMSGIFTSSKLQVKNMTQTEMVSWVIGALVVVSLFLAIYTGLPLVKPRVAEGGGTYVGKLIHSCDNQDGFTPWVGVLIAYLFVLIIGAAFLAFKTRDVPSRFNESTHIMNAIFLMIFYGILIVPLDAFIQDSPEASVLIQGVGQALAALLLTGLIFGPKLVLLVTGATAEIKSIVSNNSNTSGHSSGGDSGKSKPGVSSIGRSSIGQGPAAARSTVSSKPNASTAGVAVARAAPRPVAASAPAVSAVTRPAAVSHDQVGVELSPVTSAPAAAAAAPVETDSDVAAVPPPPAEEDDSVVSGNVSAPLDSPSLAPAESPRRSHGMFTSPAPQPEEPITEHFVQD